MPEPTLKETVAILRGLKKHYEKHHGVEIADEVIGDIAYLAKRYIHDRYMPDKAIDVVDETAAQVRVDRGKTPLESRKLTRELKQVTERMEEAVEAQDYERAARYKTRMSQINQKLSEIRDNQNDQQKLEITIDDVATTIATMTGVPVKKVIKSEAKYLMKLEKHLGEQVIGQKAAIEAVSCAIRRNRSGIADEQRPIGSFIFMGPTGVGKTELARVMATEVFGSEDALVKIDMSEFSERHTTARLVGAPAGYVGYDEGGQLTDKIRRQPYSLVLLDEIEKAHPEVFNMLLQILEDGILTDAKGRKVDFSNTIIILTSNLGAQKMQKEASLGFRVSSKQELDQLSDLHEENREAALDELKRMMRPELINRLDKVVVFNALTKKEVVKILDLQIEKLQKRLYRKGLGIQVLPNAKKKLIDLGYDATNGVRPLRRIIQEKVEDEIADGLLEERYTKGDIVKVGVRKGDFIFETITG